jgi:hypothetical protein
VLALDSTMSDDEFSDEETAVAKAVRARRSKFRFFDLPFELRLRIYEYTLIVTKTIDLDPWNSHTILPLLRLFLVSHHVHEEAYRVFYGCNTFRVFPVHARFFHTKAPLLSRLSLRYRREITKLELRVGPGWTMPPKCWVVNEKLGLEVMNKLRVLKIYVECDPSSHPTFNGYGKGKHWYTQFCLGLLREMFAKAPSIKYVEFDGFSGIEKTFPLMQALLDEVTSYDKNVSWGPERKWGDVVEIVTVDVVISMMQKLGLDRRHELIQ